MTCAQQIITTLIGTFGGFVGALLLFWIKESYQSSKKEKALVKNLSYELDYNINLLSKYEADLTQCIEAVGNDSKSVFTTIQYEKVASFFAIQFYREGPVTKYLHAEDVKRWNDFLASMSEGAEAYILDILEKWRGSAVEKEEVFKALKHERQQVKYAKEMSEYLKTRINP